MRPVSFDYLTCLKASFVAPAIYYLLVTIFKWSKNNFKVVFFLIFGKHALPCCVNFVQIKTKLLSFFLTMYQSGTGGLRICLTYEYFRK